MQSVIAYLSVSRGDLLAIRNIIYMFEGLIPLYMTTSEPDKRRLVTKEKIIELSICEPLAQIDREDLDSEVRNTVA